MKYNRILEMKSRKVRRKAFLLMAMLLCGGLASAQVLVKGNVYGGCELGQVTGDVAVTVGGGTIGDKIPLADRKVDENGQVKRIRYGNVYGGGNGYDGTDYSQSAPSIDRNLGRVQGNTSVTIKGDAVVRHAVYGGGNLGTVGVCTINDDGTTATYTTGGKTTVTIEGNALIGPTKADLTKDDEGNDLTQPVIDTAFKYLGGNEGMVFGGSRGLSGDELKELSFADTTEVIIKGNANVVGNVFGGGENGHVQKGTSVLVAENAVIGGVELHGTSTPAEYTVSGGTYDGVKLHLTAAEGELVEDDFGVGRRVFRGNVFGGGMGNDFVPWLLGQEPPVQQYSYTSGDVYGNATVQIQGGTIYNKVYGGGIMASVGTFQRTDTNNPHAITGIVQKDEKDTGHCFVTITGGQIGTNSFNNGEVYGGGRGMVGRVREEGEPLLPIHQAIDLAYVGHTHVTIDGAVIKSSVYGGSANGHVQGNTKVLIKETTPNTTYIGTAGHGAWHSNVYGGGGGTARYTMMETPSGGGTPVPVKHLSITSGRVFGDTEVEITGGKVLHNVYGGGAIASVGTYNASNLENPEYPYIGHGHAKVTITGGEIGTDGNDNGMVFGSGRGTIAEPGNFLDYVTYVAYSEVNIGTGTVNQTTGVVSGISGDAKIKGSVYGSGENGHVYLESVVNVFAGTIGCDLDEYKSYANPSSPTYDATWKTTKFPYRGNVYGAGCGTDAYTTVHLLHPETNAQVLDPVTNLPITIGRYNPIAGITQGNTKVNIYGGYISRSVYGGGAMASVGLYSVGDPHDDPATTLALSWPYEFTYSNIYDADHAAVTTGKTEVTVRGGHIGTYCDEAWDNLYALANSGDVYGGSRGMVGDRYYFVKYANVRESDVKIQYPDHTATPSAGGNFIVNSVFGGGENGHVYENTQVTIDDGLIGGTVFGGGKGKDTYWDFLKSYNTSTEEESTYLDQVHSITAGKVFGNTQVTMNNGVVQHNVYGGGEYASVGKGNYIGYGEMTGTASGPDYDLTDHAGRCVVTIKGGTIGTNGYHDQYNINNGYVYGSSKGMAYPTVDQKLGSARYDYSRDFFLGYANKTEVTIGDATVATTPAVKGSVFGGGEDGHVRWHTDVTVNKGTIGVECNVAEANSTTDEWLYRGNVYGAGRGIDKIASGLPHAGEYCSSAGSVTLNTTVTVNGGTIYRNVYGGGSMASVGPPPVANSTYNPGTSRCQVNVYGGTIGTIVFEGETNEYLYGGDVFGAGRGNLDIATTDNIGRYASAKASEAHLYDGAHIRGTLYGGGEIGQVKSNSFAYVHGGTADNSVYGAGKGILTDEKTALVMGNSTVDMTGGQIKGSIYGGGELGNVGTYIDPANPTSSDPNLPYYTAEELLLPANAGHVLGEPKGCAENTGLASVYIKGGRVGTEGSLMPTPTSSSDEDVNGYVFAGGCGALVDTTGGQNPKANLLGIVGSTYLEISQTGETAPVITASVYGGCENGLVLGNTHVKIMAGQIGTGYRGGNNWDPAYTDAQWAEAIDAVNTGTIGTTYSNPFHECDAFPYQAPYAVYDIYAGTTGYDAHGGSTQGSNGHSFFGNVFGGGSGYYPIKPGVWRRSAGRVWGDTHVEITGGHILTSVYGGNETTDVMGTCTVEMSGGTIGVPRTYDQIRSHPVTCYLFGAGMGDERVMFNTWTNVASTVVSVTGGTIFGSVFGGGEDGHVFGDAEVNIGQDAGKETLIGTLGYSYVDGNVFGGGRGYNGNALTAGVVKGNVTMTIGGGTMLGSIYGGGRLASVGTYLVPASNTSNYGQLIPDGSSTDTHGHITMTISGGTIGNDYTGPIENKCGNVFAGGMGRLEQIDGTTLNTQWPNLAKVKKTNLTITNGTIKGSVYGGGELGTVYEDAVISIEGGTIMRDVFGGGHGSDIIDADYNGNLYVLTGSSTATTVVNPAQWAGLVKNNTQLTLSSTGTIKGSMYGGGELASVGTYTVSEGVLSCTSGGTTTIFIEGGTIGDETDYSETNSTYATVPAYYNHNDPSRTDVGHVFGGGKGKGDDSDGDYQLYCNVNTTSIDVSGGRIYGSVFGGAGDAHVLGSTDIDIHTGATIGTLGVSSWDGCVFGGGEGSGDVNTTTGKFEVFKHCGRVGGNTNITMDGGTLMGTIYGGGHVALTGVKENGDPYTSDQSNHGKAIIEVSGGSIGNSITATLLASDFSVGDIFGAGRGDVDNYEDALAGRVANAQITVSGSPTIYGSVFGGGEMAGVGYRNSSNKFYSGQGETTVTINGGSIGSVEELAYTDEHGNNPNPGEWTIYDEDGKLLHTCTGNVFGGSQGDIDITKPAWVSMSSSKTATVTINGGTIMSGVFGGSEQGTVTGDTRVVIKETDPDNHPTAIGTLVTQGSGATHPYYFGYVHGAGYGSDDDDDNVTHPNDSTNISSELLAGRVYGDARLDVLGGTIKGDVYGGASFAYVGGEGTSPNGDVELNIGYMTTTTDSETDEEVHNFYGEAKILGSVYGANNRSGTPYGNVEVNVYKTAHWVWTENEVNYTNFVPTLPSGCDEWTHELLIENTNGTDHFDKKQGYAIKEVFGGGNRASYIPNMTARGSSENARSTTVHIWSCDNTIEDVYGGSNASDIGSSDKNADINLTVDGGRFYRVFSGGNGESGTPANIYGWANNTINSGVINELYGGGNQAGDILHTNLTINEKPNGCAEFIDNTFGGSNEAPIIGDVETDLLCGEGSAYEFYGGTNNADIYGNVTLNVHGGITTNLYGGSKGSERPANIKKFPAADYNWTLNPNEYPDAVKAYMIAHSPHPEDEDPSTSTLCGHGGNVIVNLYGGTITNVFGGSNIEGNIEGNIWVNVIDIENADCPLDITNLYGGCNNTDYEPVDHTAANPVISPVVNVVHIKETNTTPGYIRHNVYGGSLGYTSDVVANPVVNIGYDATTMAGYIPDDYKDNHWPTNCHVEVAGNVYGGGEEGIVNGSTTVNVFEGEVGRMEYVDSDNDHTYDAVNHVKYDGTNYGGSVFGGGMGNYSHIDYGRVKGNATVNISGGHVYYSVYGGGEMASVGEHTEVHQNNNTSLPVIDFTPNNGTGVATVNITGGQIGPNPMTGTGYDIPIALNGTDGYVFGGGKGHGDDEISSTYPYGQYYQFANVNSTEVTVNMSMASSDTLTNRIWGSVFGGAEDGHVLGDARVNYVSGFMGTKGTTSYDGNIFGGGRNYAHKNYTAGRVAGNTTVEMTGGQLFGNIYGGGRLGITGMSLIGVIPATGLETGYCQAVQEGTDHGWTKVMVKGGTIGNNKPTSTGDLLIETFSEHSMGNVYGGGMGTMDGIDVSNHPKASSLLFGLVKNTEVEISGTLTGTHVYGIVFGGGETANVGKFTWKQTGTTISDIAVAEGKAKVSISGGTIGADRSKMRYEKDPDYPMYPLYNDDLGYVYGGGEGESDDPTDAKYLPKVSTAVGELSLLDLMATVYETEVNISGGWVKASVFGGAESGHVIGNTEVNISGGQIGAGNNGGTTDIDPYDDALFVNPATTAINSSLHGTYHWPYGETLHSGEPNEVIVYNPYDPVDVMNGTKPSDGKSWFGNVFGGGSGWFPYIKDLGSGNQHNYQSYWNPNSGKVWGNTVVNITNTYDNDGNIVSIPHILNNVYGANEMTDVGGTATVKMSGGTVGVPRTRDQILDVPTFGYVFGGGCGDPRPKADNINNVESAIVEITGGIIYGSVLGGAEDGHVLGDAEVSVGQDTGKTTVIGCDGTSGVDGDIFGGGRNYLLQSYFAGRVGGNTNVEMTGGNVLGSIYGGGRNAITGIGTNVIDLGENNYQAFQNDGGGHTYGHTTVNVSGGTVGNLAKMREGTSFTGYVFGGGKGSKQGIVNRPLASALLISLVKTTDVTISGDARVYGWVFGGGEVANVGNYTWTQSGTNGTNISNIGIATNTGLSKVTVEGGIIGVDNMQMITTSGYPDDLGHVFGGGEGWTESLTTSPVVDAEGNHLVELMATVGSTEVTIKDDAFVLGSVYGGSMNGHVLTDTWVKIQGGQIGAGDGVVDASGHNRPYTDDEWDYTQHQSLAECAHWDYVEGGDPYDIYILDPVTNKPKPGKNGQTFYGNVFGGGSGYYPYGVDGSGNSQWLRSAGQVRGNTRVEVTGGHILTSLYGGCETTDVGTYRYSNVIHGEDHVSGGQSTVIMSGGTLGVPRTLAEIQAHPVTCYVFGSGKGDPRFYFNTWTNVWNSKVEIKGTAWVYGSVFGGGEEAHVLNDVDLDVSGNAKIGTLGYSYVDGNIFGGGRGFTGMALTAGTVGRKIDIDIAGGTMLGSVYGGGRLASVGTYLVDKEYNNGSGMVPNPYYGHFQPGDDHGKITINITGGTIGNDYETATLTHTNSDTYGGNVFGGCMGKYIAWSGSGDKPIWPSLARAKQTVVTISGTAKIKNSVYGGGEIGTVRDNTTVNINGGTIGADYGTSPNKMYCGSVFGGGKGIMEMSTDNDSTMVAAYLAGRVYGNTYVNINGGQVYENVFGGGKVASVGWVKTDGTFVNGEATVKMTGGIIGPLDYSGVNAYIFGGPKGGQNGDMKPYCNVNSTSVEVDYTDSNANRVWGSLFGGGSDGHVLGNASVTLKNGTVGTEGATGYDGNIFGGGRNYHESSLTAGRVGGNIIVDMQGGTLQGSIFGGGRQGLTGVDVVGAAVNDINHGNITISVTAGTVGNQAQMGNSLYSIGDVFGGGKGQPNSSTTGYDHNRLGEVRSTSVTIGGSATVNGSVYGGSENGWVLQDATTNIAENATIGYNPNEYRGNVFGGGRGADTDKNPSNLGNYSPNFGRVNGLARVNINGDAVVKRFVYGGGDMGIVAGERIVNINGGTIGTAGNDKTGDVFGGCNAVPDENSATTPPTLYTGHGGLKTVNVRGGTILGDVYGSSRSSNEGTGKDNWSSFVNITGGTIGTNGNGNGNVYGAGYEGKVNGKVSVNIGLSAVNSTNTIIASGNTFYRDGLDDDPTPALLKIKGNVFDGSNYFGTGLTAWNTYDIEGSSATYLDGTGYNTADDNESSATPYMNIAGGLYGSGTHCESGKTGRAIHVRNYGARQRTGGDNTEMTSATRALTTIQRGGVVLFDNSNIILTGAEDISHQYENYGERKFGLLEVDEGFYMANGSGLVLGTAGVPILMDSIKEVRSVYLKTAGTSYAYPNPTTPDWELVGIRNSNNHLYRTSTSTGVDDYLSTDDENVILFTGSSKLMVRYNVPNANPAVRTTNYGALYGFFRMRADDYLIDDMESFARARVKVTDKVNPVAGHSAPENTADGGFLSYNNALNDFTKPQTIEVLHHTYTTDGDDGGTHKVNGIYYNRTKQYPYSNLSKVSKMGDRLGAEDYRVWALPATLGHKWYVDGRGIGNGGWGKDATHEHGWGDYPDKPKKTITGAASGTDIKGGICVDDTENGTGYKFNPAEDIIFVVGPIDALSEGDNLNLSATYPLRLYRYPGGHPMSNDKTDAGGGTAPTDEAAWGGFGSTDPAETKGPGVNTGAMIHANKTATDFVLNNVVVDGLYSNYDGEVGQLQIPTTYTSTERFNVTKPLVVTAPNGRITLKGSHTESAGETVTEGTILKRGYNNTDASATWYHNADYEPEANVHHGALYVDANATVNVEGLVTIEDNLQKKGTGTVTSNVYLPTFDKSLTISGPLDVDTKIGVTSPVRNTADSYEDNTLSPVAEAIQIDADHPEYAADTTAKAWRQDNFLDDQNWFFGNGGHTTYYDNLGYESAGNECRSLYFGWTWANVVREAPSGFDVSNIDSKEDLAWLISLNTGMNGATATNFSDQDLLQKTDLDMKQYVWVPIGDDSHNGFEHKSFAGHFDGQGHLIKNINIDYIGRGDTRYEHQDYGLFGHVDGSVERTFVVSGKVSPKVSIDLLNTDKFNIGGLAGGIQNATLANSEAALHIYAPDEANYHVAAGGLVAKVMPGGEIHSSMAMPVMETVDKTVENATRASVGGLVGNAAGGNVYNSFVNAQFNVYGNPKAGGLMGSNDGAKVENCYVNWHDCDFTIESPFKGVVYEAGTNSRIDYCYFKQDDAILEGTAGTHSKKFTPAGSADFYGYMYDDNKVVFGPDSDTAMFIQLNHWVDSTNNANHNYAFARWARPGLTEINEDRPVLLLNDIDGTTAHQGDFSTVATIHGTNVLQYGGTVRDGNQLDGAIERMVAGSAKDAGDALFVYGDITEKPIKTPASNTKISIQEDVAIMHPGSLKDYGNTYVGITFDNSFGKATATPGMNDGLFGSDNLNLPRDWHMFSTPLSNAPLGFDYGMDNNADGPRNNPWESQENEFKWLQYSGSEGNARYWMYGWDNSLSQLDPNATLNTATWRDGYFPSQSTTFGDGWIANSDEWGRYPYGMDFYTWNEPEYHWINFKRNGPNHWHSDTPHVRLDYKPAEVQSGQTAYTLNQNEDNLIVGRGYMAAIATETFMQSHGNLTSIDTSIILTNNGWKIKGWNMVGNPYHGYLDFNVLGATNSTVLADYNGADAFYVIYDADKYQNRNASTAYRYYPVNGSPEGADYADRFLHPHQGFYVKTDTNLSKLQIKKNMLVTRDFVEKNGGSHFRATQPSYPLVNLYLNSDKGCADVTVIEFERPEWGGARKVKELRVGDGLFYAHHGDTYYAALFAKEGIDRVPLWFEAKEDDIFTMKWNMANGNFHSMYLIDNITGVQYDMLRNDTYTFEGHKEDYPSRFLIVFDLTDVEEFEDDNEHPFAFFNGSEWVVTGEGDLEFIDMLGRVLAKSHISGQNRITLPMVADGPYLFRLTNHKETRIQKVIVTK